MRTKTLTAPFHFCFEFVLLFFFGALSFVIFTVALILFQLFPCEAPLKPGVGLLWSLSINFLPLLINSNLRAKVGYALLKLQVYRWWDKQAFRLADGLSSPVDLACVSLDCGSRSTWRELVQAQNMQTEQEWNPMTFLLWRSLGFSAKRVTGDYYKISYTYARCESKKRSAVLSVQRRAP